MEMSDNTRKQAHTLPNEERPALLLPILSSPNFCKRPSAPKNPGTAVEEPLQSQGTEKLTTSGRIFLLPIERNLPSVSLSLYTTTLYHMHYSIFYFHIMVYSIIILYTLRHALVHRHSMPCTSVSPKEQTLP